jgi:hypothetical protein
MPSKRQKSRKKPKAPREGSANEGGSSEPRTELQPLSAVGDEETFHDDGDVDARDEYPGYITMEEMESFIQLSSAKRLSTDIVSNPDERVKGVPPATDKVPVPAAPVFDYQKLTYLYKRELIKTGRRQLIKSAMGRNLKHVTQADEARQREERLQASLIRLFEIQASLETQQKAEDRPIAKQSLGSGGHTAGSPSVSRSSSLPLLGTMDSIRQLIFRPHKSKDP